MSEIVRGRSGRGRSPARAGGGGSGLYLFDDIDRDDGSPLDGNKRLRSGWYHGWSGQYYLHIASERLRQTENDHPGSWRWSTPLRLPLYASVRIYCDTELTLPYRGLMLLFGFMTSDYSNYYDVQLYLGDSLIKMNLSAHDSAGGGFDEAIIGYQWPADETLHIWAADGVAHARFAGEEVSVTTGGEPNDWLYSGIGIYGWVEPAWQHISVDDWVTKRVRYDHT